MGKSVLVYCISDCFFFFLALKICFSYKRISRENCLPSEEKREPLTYGYKIFIYDDELFCMRTTLSKALLWTPSLDSIVNSAGFCS